MFELALGGVLGVALFLALAAARGLVAHREQQDPAKFFGPLNPALVCPHCQVAGHVHVRQETVKGGISGAKAAGAVLTFGTSVLVTGLSQKAQVTQALCAHCKTTWTI